MDPQYLLYEKQVVNHHTNTYNQTTWHQHLIPENVYFDSGYIHDWNKHRLRRIIEKREGRQCPLLPDYGLDFISYDPINKSYHGGQVKMYEKSRLTASDCATFLNCVNYRLNTKGYLYTSKNKLECNFREDIQASRGKIEHIVLPFQHNDNNEDNHSFVNETNLPLYVFQEECINSVLEAETKKTMLRLTTGTGKTLIAANIIKRMNFDHLICIAPLLFSVDQLCKRISSFVQNHKVIVMDCEGTTNIHDIQESTNNNDKWIIFTTFKSFEELVPQINISYEDTFLLIDEVHNAFNKKDLCEIANSFENSLYLSATIPDKLQDVLDFEEVYSYNIRDAINDGICVDYNVFLPFVESRLVPNEVNHLDNTSCNQALFLATGMLQEGKRRCIVYLSSIEEAIEFESIIKEVFMKYHGIDIDTYNIHCKVSTTRRNEIVEDFCKNDYTKIKIIANVRILDEAIDLVPCDCVYITKVCNNEITTVQRLGRAIRKDKFNPTKQAALFIWCEDWEDCVQSLQLLKQEDIKFNSKMRIISKDYVKTKESVKKVCVHENEFIKFVEIKCLTPSEIWEVRRQNWVIQFTKKGNKTPSKSSKDLEEKRTGQWQSQNREFYKKKTLSQERIDALNNTHGWKFEEDPFEEQLQNWVIQFTKKENKKPSESSKDLEEKRAGQWQSNMRHYYKKKTLSKERIDALNKTYGWAWDEDPFEEQLQKWVIQFRKKCNNKPSESSKDLEEKRTGKWQSTMRQNYKKGKLSHDRIDALNKTYGWAWDEEDPFEEQLQNWVIQFERKGNKKPSQTPEDLEENRAGQWQSTIRKLYKKEKLSKERIDALNKTYGWAWDEDRFEEQLQNWVIQFTKKCNNKLSKSSKDLEENRAGQWQSNMRQYYRNGKLSKERITALNNIYGWAWEEDPFEEQLHNWIKQFTKKGNKTPIKRSKDLEEKRAGQWQSRMRHYYKKKTLPQERIDTLNKTYGWTWEGR
jgi:superfamily II DNA or RNA helicase